MLFPRNVPCSHSHCSLIEGYARLNRSSRSTVVVVRTELLLLVFNSILFFYMCRSWVNRHRHCYLNKGVAQAKSSDPTFIHTWKQKCIFSITLAWRSWLVERGSATSRFHAAVPQCAMFFFYFWIHTIFCWASQHCLPFVVHSSMKSKFLNTISIAQFVVENFIWMCLSASSNATDWTLNEKCENAVYIVTWKSLHIYFHKASKLLANVNTPQHNSCRWRLAKRKIIQFLARTLF